MLTHHHLLLLLLFLRLFCFCCGCATAALRNPRLDGSISGQALAKTAGSNWRHTRAARFLQRRWRARKRGEDISIGMADVGKRKRTGRTQRMYSAEGWAEQKARQDAARKGYEQRKVLEAAKAKREKEEEERRAAEAAERRASAEADVEAALREAASNQREGAPAAMHDPAYLLAVRAESTGEDLSLALEILAGERARGAGASRTPPESPRGGRRCRTLVGAQWLLERVVVLAVLHTAPEAAWPFTPRAAPCTGEADPIARRGGGGSHSEEQWTRKRIEIVVVTTASPLWPTTAKDCQQRERRSEARKSWERCGGEMRY